MILFDLEMVEGEDRTRELGAPEFDEAGMTRGLLLRLKKSLHNSAHYVAVDSGSVCWLHLLH